MTFPYQCLGACNYSLGNSHEWTLFGASGPRLVVQSSSGASSVWPAAEVSDIREAASEDESQERPGKRIKLSPQTEAKSNFSCLVVSNDKQHIVAVTAEDKCIRVFRIDSQFRLHELSQRCMAKRPCSITLTSDDSTILCADKFGDVYALPLIPCAEDEVNESAVGEKKEEPIGTQYTPSASVLTVHSGRNRKVLEEQLKQAKKEPKKVKEALKFKHELLLGHVSMLTDVVYATVDSRSYIITADRDEHVRVSRGLPQAHIIEGFCQGHEEFVSRLCLTGSGLLVSGGGDPNVFVWDWQNYTLLEKVCIRDEVLRYYRAQPQLAALLPEDESAFKVAVSGIWSVPSSRPKEVIIVACEGVPALFSFQLGKPSTCGEVIPLIGNALDLKFIHVSESECTAVVSVDNVHKPGSTTETLANEGPSRLQSFAYQQDGTWGEDLIVGKKLEGFNRRAWAENSSGGAAKLEKSRLADEKAVQDILYGVENLRKRAGVEG
ncbi:guanine-N(7)--methyltransferase subunit TRM82 [Pleomassaria siparia CBS 279.74]|uniref:Guanine-N(7)--methyltransferase subunit TRM82 n=1 Tax=Pleomassaria siparia CBS 279.74 TaxID=1314801 RepID=A0A6G1JYC0_9PLEO|nr:guanine-N(7)--methyltransferase subunit TRM82 [Pleomassaria siparia CBS 279.74]